MLERNGRVWSVFARPEDVRNVAQNKLFESLQNEARKAGINYKNVSPQKIDADGVLRLLPDSFPHDVRFAAKGVHSINRKHTHSAGGWMPLSDETANEKVAYEAAHIADKLSCQPELAHIAIQRLGGSVIAGAEALLGQTSTEAFDLSAGD